MIKYSHRFSLGLIILAGGESSRMGHDKATLPWNGTDLLTDLLLRSQRAPFAERIVSINRDYSPKNLPAKLARSVRTIADNVQHCGPLGGLEAAMRDGECDYYLVLSVDLPFYDFSPISDILRPVRRDPELMAVIPRTKDGRDQPLAALYSRELVPAIAQQLRTGNYCLQEFLQKIPTATLKSCRPALYLNVNTMSDYEAAKGRAANSRRKVPVVTLTAPHSGDEKTTAAETAIAELTRRGYHVAYIKSTHHTDCRPKAGSDTDRARSAGAVSACLCSPDMIGPEAQKEDVIFNLTQQQLADLVLVESHSHGPFPQIDIQQADSANIVNHILFLTGYRSSEI